jgi:hypothetical protein
MEKAIFHLAFPVNDLAEAKSFYVQNLDCTVGRDTGQWCDIHFFGHQITLHQKPEQVTPAAEQGVRHFGAVLDWPHWERVGVHLQSQGVAFLKPPTVNYQGTEREEGKILLRDPSGYVIELKAYRHPDKALQG